MTPPLELHIYFGENGKSQEAVGLTERLLELALRTRCVIRKDSWSETGNYFLLFLLQYPTLRY